LPIDEAGRTNAKFTAPRDVIRRYLPPGTVLPDPPPPFTPIPLD
jgi:hypothetical protein